MWEAIPHVPDLQAAWQILLHCAGPRCHHMLRTLPPSESEEYARAHDVGMARVMDRLLALPGDPHEQEVALNLASLPMRMGGLGLRRALRMAPATYWSSWADALHMIDQRLPEVAATVIRKLTAEEDPGGCFQELRDATAQLDREGFIGRPHWHELRTGIRPRAIVDSEPGEWPHGWQHYASSSSEHSFRKNVVLNQSCAADQAHFRSHSGPGASEALSTCPSKPEFRIEAELFRTIILERLRLPLQVSEARCECGAILDREGRHRAACARSGRLKTRALAPERTLARVCREAGATVRYNARLRDMNVAVTAQDDRAVEVLASGLPLFFGAQLAVDITLRCALTAEGTAQPGAARFDGAVCSRAREEKERKYVELLRGDRCRLVVVESLRREVDGAKKARQMLQARHMFHSAALAWRRRWSRLLSVSCARSFASSLVALPTAMHALGGADGCAPDLADLFAE